MFKIMIAIMLAGVILRPCFAEFRDPTQPTYPLPATAADTESPGNHELVLSAIWISSRSKRATINGVSGKQGQVINIGPASSDPANANTIKIIRIHKNSVIIDQNGERKTLQLVQRPYKIQQTPSAH